MKVKNQYCVWYEVVNLETRKTDKRILVSGVDFKRAHAVKRQHKNICAMHVSRWMPSIKLDNQLEALIGG